MTEEKNRLLEKIHKQIKEKKDAIIDQLPVVHKVDDGVIIRFFTHWDNCEDDNKIKFKKIVNHDKPDESIVFFYIPKGAFFDLQQRFYIGCMTCLNGKIKVTYGDETKYLEGYSKICVETAEIQGWAKENTYLLTTSDRSDWSETTKKHVQKAHG
jgi:hypothetical protein